MSELTDKAREEFYSEAQEIVETLARNLLKLDELSKHDSSDPSLINEAFRAVHTLKGLAGLFGSARVGTVAHRLEDVLDNVRLGRQSLTAELLDVLFRGVEVTNQLLASEKEQRDEPVMAVDDLFAALEMAGSPIKSPPRPSAEYELDPGMLAVLTEYEEHRLRTNIEQGLNLYRLRVEFDLNTIDRALEEIKERAKVHGEIITYLPTGETSSPDTIQLDLLLASRDEFETLVRALGGESVIVEAIPRRPVGSLPARRPSLLPSMPAPEALGRQSAEPGDRLVPSPRAEAGETTLRSVSQTVRVDIRRLDHLMNIVGELAIVRGSLARMADRVRGEGLRGLATELQRLYRSFDRRLTEMQDGILEVRMVPLGQIFDRLARVVRQLGREAGKDIRLVITGGETEIDKLIVEELSDPLMHMIRNSIDHGIEDSERRHKVGKPVAGTIALNAFQKGNHVMIEIEDDGSGIDEQALLERAVVLGKLDPREAQDLSRDDVLGLIFLPGLSTSLETSDLSGRGVGMDVVKTNISRLGGVIDVQSERGIGTKIAVTLPITLAIVSALLLDVAGHVLAIPLSSVSEALRFDGTGVRVVDGREVMTLRGTTLPLCRLDRLLGLRTRLEHMRQFVVVASLGNRRLGLVVDQLYGQQDIVIKPLGRSLSAVRGFSGATELGDQRVGLVLDAAALIEEVLAGAETRDVAREGTCLPS
jgi:two-component system, chemotaxis family, sensor kinase CheA